MGESVAKLGGKPKRIWNANAVWRNSKTSVHSVELSELIGDAKPETFLVTQRDLYHTIPYHTIPWM